MTNECRLLSVWCFSAVSVSNHSILAQYCKDHNVSLVVVGPEVPLAAGESFHIDYVFSCFFMAYKAVWPIG